jgi:hypothetical protein
MPPRLWSDGRPARPRQTRQAPQKSKCDPYQGTPSGGPMPPVKAEQKFAAAENIDNCYGFIPCLEVDKHFQSAQLCFRPLSCALPLARDKSQPCSESEVLRGLAPFLCWDGKPDPEPYCAVWHRAIGFAFPPLGISDTCSEPLSPTCREPSGNTLQLATRSMISARTSDTSPCRLQNELGRKVGLLHLSRFRGMRTCFGETLKTTESQMFSS